MKKIILILLSFLMMQSCETYKTVSIPEMKKEKTYEITLKNGQSIKTKCKKIGDENISVLVNNKVMVLPKSKIEQVRRRKVSIVKKVNIYC